MRNCCDCGNPISPERLEFKPSVQYCVECADRHEPVSRCRVIYSHKTAGELFVARGAENVRRLDREYNRSR
jgi:hypothetical protein